MRRALHNTAVVVGVLLAVSLCVLWRRSVTEMDTVSYVQRSGDRWAVDTIPHAVEFWWSDIGRVTSTNDATVIRPGWYAVRSAYGEPAVAPPPPPAANAARRPAPIVSTAAPMMGPTTLATSAPVAATPPDAELPAVSDLTVVSSYTVVTSLPVPPTHRWAGFGFQWGTCPPVTCMPDYRMRSVDVPFWFLVPASLLPAAERVAHAYRGRRRRRSRQCLTCGYDLRGSPGRCPECGTAAVL